MRITFLADLRSSIAVQWIKYFVERGHEVQAISSHPLSGDELPGAETTSLPLVLAGPDRSATAASLPPPGRRPSMTARLATLATPGRAAAVRSVIGPAWLRTKHARLQRLIDDYRPDLVHAMRIPFEGIAAGALAGPPLIVSTWGNDLTLFANRTPAMARATRRTLARTSVLHCDCRRDADLALDWGFPAGRPIWVLPGNGGVDRSVFHPGPGGLRHRLGLPPEAVLILNPRGIREYVRTDTFFAALAPVLRSRPDVHVACPGMAGSRVAENLIAGARLDRSRVHLLPKLDRRLMADAFRASRVSVSLSEHDGTPNTLLEAMACGTLPVVGDVASVREWIKDGTNGIVISAQDPHLVAIALERALSDDALVAAGGAENQRLVADLADYDKNMVDIESKYELVLHMRQAEHA